MGGFGFVDLDTPWFMKNAPVAGGWVEHGATLRLDHITSGHGVDCTLPRARADWRRPAPERAERELTRAPQKPKV